MFSPAAVVFKLFWTLVCRDVASSYTLTLLNRILGRSSCSILSLGQAGMTSGISKTLTRSNLKPPQLTDFFVWVEIKTPKKLSSLQTQTDVTPPCMPINSHWPHSKEHGVPFDFGCFLIKNSGEVEEAIS